MKNTCIEMVGSGTCTGYLVPKVFLRYTLITKPNEQRTHSGVEQRTHSVGEIDGPAKKAEACISISCCIYEKNTVKSRKQEHGKIRTCRLRI